MNFTTKLNAYRRLGLANLFRVAAYRLRVRAGAFAGGVDAALPDAPFFEASVAVAGLSPAADWDDVKAFGWFPVGTGKSPPDWLADPFTKTLFPDAAKPWYELPDFEPRFGDIKLVWELSRFGWVVPMAQAAAAGDASALEALNQWLRNWAEATPPYLGPNWKCGQEAGIRVIHLACAALLLKQAGKATATLQTILALHCDRIAPTMSYARGQDNNHGTSEAAALFIGGSWLAACGHKDGARWAKIGRRWLDERVLRLIAPDGSFSQHSVTYHRLALDTLSVAELWRAALNLPDWRSSMRTRCAAASKWLRAMTIGRDGDAPNLGHNDGAHIFALAGQSYRDFRPSCRLAAKLFEGVDAFADLDRNIDQLAWLGIAPGSKPAQPSVSTTFDDGGYAVLVRGAATVVMRYARFAFRPSQADVNHIDLWLDGAALLRDGGTYSYNSTDEWAARLAGVEGHNTVQFGDTDQMPRVSRFLFGDWLDAGQVEPVREDQDATSFTAGYTSSDGRRHERRVELHADHLIVHDDLSGTSGEATVRWRLAPAGWSVRDNRLAGPISGEIGCTGLRSTALSAGRESLDYYAYSDTPVWEARVSVPSKVTTIFRWSL